MEPINAWAISFTVLAALWLAIAWLQGPQRAIGCVVLLAALVPTWCRIEVSTSVWIDVRVAVTIFCLLGYCLHPRSTYPYQLGPVDLAMICLLVIHILSDIDNSGWSFSIPVRVYGEWCVAYLAGRLALHRSEDFGFLAPWGVAVGVVLAGSSVFEAFSGEHPFAMLYGNRPVDGADLDQERWSLTRAWGCCAHPIYFGFLQVMFLPWLLRLLHVRGGALWGCGFAALCLAGIYATGSRAALLISVLVPLVGWFLVQPRLRVPMIVSGILLMVLGISQRDTVVEWVRRWAEPDKVYSNGKIVVEDKLVDASGTMTRFYLLQVYRPAMIKASWLGFGTDRVTGFPVRVPVGPQDEKTLQKVPYIDNQYVLMILRFGWLGIGVFVMALLLAILSWALRASLFTGGLWSDIRHSSDRALAGYATGATLAVSTGLVTVWMPHDIGFPLLWWMGAGSSLSVKDLLACFNRSVIEHAGPRSR